MKICLIDDDALVRDALTFSLADAGHEVMAADNGAAGLAALAAGGADVVVTDLKMSGVGGADVAAAVRRLYPQMAIVLISGQLPAGQDGGADVSLQKPFTARQLLTAIEAARAKRKDA